MNAMVQKWGNSHGIRIPRIILDQSGISENDKLELCVCEEGIMLKKISNKKHRTLEKRLEEFYGKPIDEIGDIRPAKEVNTGDAAGEEIW